MIAAGVGAGAPGHEILSLLLSVGNEHRTPGDAKPAKGGHRKATGRDLFLKQDGVTETDGLGLATDYCVKFTALDAKELGFATYVLADACRGVDLQAGDVAAALHDMKAAGVQIITGEAS